MLAGPSTGNDCLSFTNYTAVVHTLTHLEVKVIMNLHISKASVGFFLQVNHLPEETCFHKGDLRPWKVPARVD